MVLCRSDGVDAVPEPGTAFLPGLEDYGVAFPAGVDLADLQVVDLTYEDVLQAIPVRRALRRTGRSIGTWDLMIAGQALHRGWTVISHNLREYTRVEGLSVETWVGA